MTSAPLRQQRRLIDLQSLDSRLARLTHERAHLPVLSRIEATVRRLRDNRRDAAVAAGALADAKADVARAEGEVGQVVRRAAILRERLSSGAAAARDLGAIQGEIDQLGRRQSILEDTQIAAMEAQEAARDAAFVRLDGEIKPVRERRADLAGTIDAALLAEYEAAREATGGIGAIALYGRRVEGAVEIGPAEHARIAAAPQDAVIHAEANDVILVRMEE